MGILKNIIHSLLIQSKDRPGVAFPYRTPRGLIIWIRIDRNEDFVRLKLTRPTNNPADVEFQVVMEHWPFKIDSFDRPEKPQSGSGFAIISKIHMDLNLIPSKD